jgi:hypothetical protein
MLLYAAKVDFLEFLVAVNGKSLHPVAAKPSSAANQATPDMVEPRLRLLAA